MSAIIASVQVVRPSDAGHGVAAIGEQIRPLSKDASAALHHLAGH